MGTPHTVLTSGCFVCSSPQDCFDAIHSYIMTSLCQFSQKSSVFTTLVRDLPLTLPWQWERWPLGGSHAQFILAGQQYLRGEYPLLTLSSHLFVPRISQGHSIITWDSEVGHPSGIPLSVGKVVKLFPNCACVAASFCDFYFVIDSCPALYLGLPIRNYTRCNERGPRYGCSPYIPCHTLILQIFSVGKIVQINPTSSSKLPGSSFKLIRWK